MTSLVNWMSKVWSFGLQKFGNFDIKSLVNWMSKVWSLRRQKFGSFDIKSLVIWMSKSLVIWFSEVKSF